MFCDVEIKRRRVADNNQVDFIGFQKPDRLPYKPIKVKDVCKGIVRHHGPADGVLRLVYQRAAGLCHFSPAHTRKLYIAPLVTQCPD
jgi:hypothetical protein